jgi:hypothetical protein
MQYQQVTQLSEEQRVFFHKISSRLKLPVYIYGSITRWDYIPGKSDIDAVIFSLDEHNTAQRLGQYLGVPPLEIKRTVYKIGHTLVRGYKLKYIADGNSIAVEMSVYPTRYKDIVLNDHRAYLPVWIICLLWWLKMLYYWTGLIPSSHYRYWKRVMMNQNSELKFVVLD